ncbi:MAG: DUF3237 domain-containing protein [Actinobacteria bacterium]|nr:DUF3237 domain-containing protein [Actinomycetota bacterium]
MTLDDIATPSLRHVADVHVELGPLIDVGEVLLGRRRVVPITGGSIRGPGLEATILPGGADTQLVTADGTIVVDTRYVALTDAGAHITLATQGFRHGPPEVLARLAVGELVGADEYVFRLTARLEAADQALAWVNATVFVGSAARRADAVDYRMYALV